MIQLAISISVTLILALSGFLYRRHRKLRSLYSLIWKPSPSLKPKDILGERPYIEYYYKRPENDLIRDGLSNSKNILIIGPPLSGKTRAVFQTLINLSRPYNVIKPLCNDINIEVFIFPNDFKFWNPKVMFIDDMHRFVEKQNFEHLFRVSKEKKVSIIATCQSGIEYEKVKKRMLERSIDVNLIFGENIVEFKRLEDDEGKKIVSEVGIDWNKVKFNGTVGSIFLPLNEIERRYNECTNIERTILQLLKDLHKCGIYQENHIFPLEWIKTSAKRYEFEGRDYEWSGWLKELEGKEFIKIVRKDRIWAEEVYLDSIVKPIIDMSNLELFGEMIETFSDTADALLLIGIRSFYIGCFDIARPDYMKTSIRAYLEALKTYDINETPLQYAKTQDNLGRSYAALADVESKQVNSRKAISAYEEALKVYTYERYPIDHSNVLSALGIAYRLLSEGENKGENCKKAIEAHNKALKVRTIERMPVEYAMTQHSLGIVYYTLSEVEDKVENCKRAINANLEALRVMTIDEFPREHALTLISLGNTYGNLSEVENRVENCRKAITSYEEALNILTYKQYPYYYAIVHINLGTVYGSLAKVENGKENSLKSIKALEESLRLFTIDKFPMLYATSYRNLGDTYRILAEFKDRIENYKKSISAYEEALRIFTEEESADVHNLLKNAIEDIKKEIKDE